MNTKETDGNYRAAELYPSGSVWARGRLLTRAALLCDCPEQSRDREGAPKTSLETRT